MRKRIASQGIGSATYETTDAKFRNPEIAKQHRKFLKLLDDEQRSMGPRYRVKLEVRNYGDVLVPFFSYERRSDAEMKIDETLRRVREMLEREGRKP